MKKAFTIVELLVAVGLLTGLLAASGIIFKSAINAQRAANATAEITRKLRTITDQLTADFEGLIKTNDGMLFAVWVPYSLYPSDNNHVVDYADYTDEPDDYINFDRLMFFTTGNFYTYHQRFGDIRGTEARICYMLAHKDYENNSGSAGIERDKRILARSQHILTTTTPGIPQDFPNFGSIPNLDFEGGPENRQYMYMNCTYEHDWAIPADWINADPCDLVEMFTVSTDIQFGDDDPTEGGLVVNTDDPNSIHMLLAEGVGEFKVQRWRDAEQRWYPEVNPYNESDLNNTDYFVHSTDTTRLDVDGWVRGRSLFGEDVINNIEPALKFTFTLYDSRGIFPEGKTFTHIVYLDN